MKKTLIVLEGVDASGKSTQFKRVCEWLKQTGKGYKQLTFPQYNENSSWPLRMYLQGEFGKNPNDVGAYAASTFFAVDRYASYKKDWHNAYENGTICICDRYTTSNAYHQGSKLEKGDRENFFKWLYDFEFEKLQLPKPDLVLFLDLPPSLSKKLLEKRIIRGVASDIHEKDAEYLKNSYETAMAAADFYGWEKITCYKNDEILSINEINNKIKEKIECILQK